MKLVITIEPEEFGYRAETNIRGHYHYSAFGETQKEALTRLADQIDFPIPEGRQ